MGNCRLSPPPPPLPTTIRANSLPTREGNVDHRHHHHHHHYYYYYYYYYYYSPLLLLLFPPHLSCRIMGIEVESTQMLAHFIDRSKITKGCCTNIQGLGPIG